MNEWCLSPTYNSYHSYAWSFRLYFYPCCHRFQFLPTLPFSNKKLLWIPKMNDIVQLIPYRSDKPSIWPACFNYLWCCVVNSCEQCTCIFGQVDLHWHPDCQVALSRSAWQYLCQHPEMLQGLWRRCVVFGRMQPNDKINVTLAKRNGIQRIKQNGESGIFEMRCQETDRWKMIYEPFPWHFVFLNVK